jgi:antitoxin HigA-1
MAIAPTHPGVILRKEFLEPMGITAYRLAKELHVTVPRVNDIVRGRRNISSDMALRLSKYFGMSEEFWSTLQADYDLRVARQKLGKQLETITPREELRAM